MELLISIKEKKEARAGTAGIKLEENFLPLAFSHEIKVGHAHRGRSWNFFPPEIRLLHSQMLLKIPAAGVMAAAAGGGGKLLTHFPSQCAPWRHALNAASR